MPRNVKSIMADMGLPDESVSPQKAAQMVTGYVAENLHKKKQSHGLETDKAVELIDDKRLLGELIEEFLPIFKRMRTLPTIDDQLNALAKLVPMVLGRSMMFGSDKESRAAATEILNRVQGKPIERTMTMSMNLHSLSMTEIDNELKRLDAKFAGTENTETPIDVGERKNLGGDES